MPTESKMLAIGQRHGMGSNPTTATNRQGNPMAREGRWIQGLKDMSEYGQGCDKMPKWQQMATSGNTKKPLHLIPKHYPPRNCWLVEVPASAAGKRKRYFFPTETGAIQGASEISLRVAMGDLPVPKNKTRRVASLAASFLAEREFAVGELTQRQLRWGIGLLVERFGNRAVEDITPVLVKAWIGSLDLKPRSRFNAFSVGRTFFNWHGVRSLIEENPFQDAPPKRAKDDRLQILTVEEAGRLLAFPFPKFFHNWIVGGMFAGMRTCEMLRIPWSALDFDYKEITIRKADSKGGEASRPRTITMTEAFERHILKATEEESKELFLEKKTRWEFEKNFKVAATLLNRDVYPANILRHTFASMLLASNRDAVRTAYEMGHTSPTLLYQTYANAVSRKEAETFWAIPVSELP
jgi:integrase